jgi:hypothetical protein
MEQPLKATALLPDAQNLPRDRSFSANPAFV